MKILKRILYILRFALGANLFTLFVYFVSGRASVNVPIGSISFAYIGFIIITLLLFLELGYIIVRTRSLKTKGVESKIIARAVFFLFDSTYIMLAAITAFAALYMIFPVIDAPNINGRDALYFSMVTFTTLGYGDLTPTDQFRIIAAGEAMLGYITLGIIVGYASSLFSIDSRIKDINI